MRSSNSLPALKACAPVTTRTSRRETGTACASVAHSAHADNIAPNSDRCNFMAPSGDSIRRYHSRPGGASPAGDLHADLTIFAQCRRSGAKPLGVAGAHRFGDIYSDELRG